MGHLPNLDNEAFREIPICHLQELGTPCSQKFLNPDVLALIVLGILMILRINLAGLLQYALQTLNGMSL